MNIASLLTAASKPDRPALIFSSPTKSRNSFRELDDLSSRLAEGFCRNGLRANDRIVILASISLDLYTGLIALFKIGATAVFLDPQTGFRQLDRAVELVEVNGLICSNKALWLSYFSAALRRIPHVFLTEGNTRRSIHHLAGSFSPRTTVADIDEKTPALITFTGGSTDSSGPRGVIRTHHILSAQHFSLSRNIPVQPGDVDLPAFPVATLHNLASGITSVIPDFPFRRPDAVRPEKILGQIDEFGITTASGSPAYWSAIAKYCLRTGRNLPLRRIVTGGAPPSSDLIQQLCQVAPKAQVLSVYGSTEAEPVAITSADEYLGEVKTRIETGSGVPLGRPVPDICVRILDENGREQSAGQVGEIWVSGEHVARNYFADPGAESINKRFDAEGRLWHRMGDLGYRDETERLWLVGRVNTIILRDGRPIYPVPIETAVARLSFVNRAALIGVPDTKLGERSALIVEFATDAVKPDEWRAKIQALCVEHGWIVDEIYPIRHLPMDARHNSRIDYQRLKSKMIRR